MYKYRLICGPAAYQGKLNLKTLATAWLEVNHNGIYRPVGRPIYVTADNLVIRAEPDLDAALLEVLGSEKAGSTFFIKVSECERVLRTQVKSSQS
jgi:hypothetical protein